MVKLVKPSFEIEPFEGDKMLERIEQAGRTCYASQHKVEPGSAPKFVRMILDRGHESVLEHEKITVRVICDRGVTHEIVRHRIGSYSQESTRYCNYSNDRFGKEIAVINPIMHINNEALWSKWYEAMLHAEQCYMALIDMGVKPQMARSVLPNSLKTEIVITYNLREWRYFFKLRTSNMAHPQMREITIPMLAEFKARLPVVFADIDPEA